MPTDQEQLNERLIDSDTGMDLNDPRPTAAQPTAPLTSNNRARFLPLFPNGARRRMIVSIPLGKAANLYPQGSITLTATTEDSIFRG